MRNTRRRKHFIQFLIYFILGFAICLLLNSAVLPFYTDKTGLEYISDMLNNKNDIVAVSDDDVGVGDTDVPEPFIYIPPSVVGGFGHYVVNMSYYNDWFNDSMSWIVESSIDKITWKSYSNFNVKRVWNDTNCKFTVSVFSDFDAFYRVSFKTLNGFLEYNDLSVASVDASNDMVMRFEPYTMCFNWDDYLASDVASTSVMSKAVVSDKFDWSVSSNGQILKGGVFVVDPTYGEIGGSTVDYWEWDTEEGETYSRDCFLRLGDSNYYLVAAQGDTGTENDGYLRVMEINDNGTFVESLVDTWEYDDTEALGASIYHLIDDVYIVVYSDTSNGEIFTTRAWANNGTLQKTKLSSKTFTDPYYAPTMANVVGDVWALTYFEQGSPYDHFLETYIINSTTFVISDRVDVEEYDESNIYYHNLFTPDIVKVDDDTVAIAYSWHDGYDGRLITYNISNTGVITDTPADYWEFDSTEGVYSNIMNIGDDVFAITYRTEGGDAKDDGYIKTLTILDSGDIDDSWIDTLLFDSNFNSPVLYPVVEGSIYAVTYQGLGADGYISTFNMSSNGTIGDAIIDYLEFDASDSMYWAGIQHIIGDYYAICYTGTGFDGAACTVEILTPSGEPVEEWHSIVTGINGSFYNQTKWLNIIDGINGSFYNITAWHIISSGINGSFYNQTKWLNIIDDINGSFFNITIWHSAITDINGSFYNQTKWFNIVDSINGSFYNQSKWLNIADNINGSFYNRTTWQPTIIDINGSFYNITVWQPTIIDINGSFYNQTNWLNIIDNINGSFYNQTKWFNIVDSINGSFWNGTTYKTIVTDVNGSFYNITIWHPAVININGSFYNQTSWLSIVDDVNGSFYNQTMAIWNKISTGINGSFYNISVWQAISTDINGSFFNITIYHVISTDVNGSFYNQTKWLNIININGSFYNITTYKPISTIINGSFYNVSVWQAISTDVNGSFWNTTLETWQSISTGINGSFWNISMPWHTIIIDINGSFYNITTLITITNEYPNNQSRIQNLQPLIYFTLTHKNSKAMNYSIYIGNSSSNTTTLLFSKYGVMDGVQIDSSQIYYTANNTGRYYYRVHAWANSTSINETYYFNCILAGGGITGATGMGAVMGLAAGALLLSIFGVFAFLRRKRKNG